MVENGSFAAPDNLEAPLSPILSCFTSVGNVRSGDNDNMPTEAWTVHIGPGATRAAFVLPDFESLRKVLEMFTKEK